MSVQVVNHNFNEAVARADKQKQVAEKVTIMTAGEVIGMISMILSSIIHAIQKSGEVSIRYLETSIDSMLKSAVFKEKAAKDQIVGTILAASIGIGLTGLGMGLSIASMGKNISNANEMKKIQSAPIAEPQRNIGQGINARRINEREIAQRNQVAENGGAIFEVERSGIQSNANREKVLHGRSKESTSYASEAERERAMKIQDELNKNNKYAQLASVVNNQTLPIGSVAEASKKEDAAKAQHASEVEGTVTEAVRTLQSENTNFYGALSGQIDKLGIANIVTQTIIASSQWK